jgi:pyrroloquinoline quinone (PQQ) biosynthesis protein C
MFKLTDRTQDKINNNISGYTREKGTNFLVFLERIHKELLDHEIINNNKFTKKWATTNLSQNVVKNFIIQFSVFSNQFLIAQLQKVINSDSIESARESKEILANEIGVIFNSKKRKHDNNDKVDNTGLVSTTGTVDGGTYRFAAAHFEWLYKIATKLDLEFNQIGKRQHGNNTTLYFCDKLIELYGGEDNNRAIAVSYAIENWAAAGFWKDLINGLRNYNSTTDVKLPLSYFTWHDKIEDQHAEHTQEELEELYFTKDLNENNFIKDGNEMLDALLIFWNGLKI